MGEVPAGPDTLTVTFVPTVDDQVRAQRALISSRLGRFLAVAAPFMMAAMTLLVVLTSGWRALWGTAWIFPFMLVVALVPGPFTRWAIVRNRRQNPHLVGPQAYTFSDAGVHIQTPAASVDVPWTSFVRARETPQLFLLYIARKAAYFLPRRALRDHDEARLRELVDRHLGARAELTYQRNR